MKYQLILIAITLLLISCENKPKKPDLRLDLEGQWSLIGNYKFNKLTYDTMYTSIHDYFDQGHEEIMSYTIRTDSGVFIHSYSNNQITVRRKNESFITEYIFSTDSSGIALQYEMDLNKKYKEHPKTFDIKDDFQIKSENGLNYFIFNYPNNEHVEVVFSLINKDTMKITFNKDEYNLFTRVKTEQ